MRPFFGRIYCSLFPHHAAAALHEEVTKGHVKRVKARLTARPDLVFSKDKYGRTPLHFTARSDVTELLLASGAHVNPQGNEGRTPLHVAAGGDHGPGPRRLVSNEG